jgi:formate C-acetyltransferase
VLLLQVIFPYFEELGLERARSLGPVDRLWYPFYRNDLESGACSLEEIKEYMRFFFIHYTASKRFAQQPMCLGGRNKKGESFVNELTYLILDVYDEMNIYDPKIHFRYHSGIDDKIILKLLDMIRRGNSSLCILNDETIFESYRRMDIPAEDFRQRS